MSGEAESVHALLRRITALRGPHVYVFPSPRVRAPWWKCADLTRAFEKIGARVDPAWSAPEVERHVGMRLDFLHALNDPPALIAESASVYTIARFLVDYLARDRPRARAVKRLRREVLTSLSHVNDMALWAWEE